MKLSITIACGDYDRTAAIKGNIVSVEGCNVNFIPLSPEEAFYRAFTNAEFDVTEMSFSSYLSQTARGECQYIAIPVFLSRSFRHSAFYVRSDRIKSPSDLRGAVVGVPEYQVTAAVWARGILADEFGVNANEMIWKTGGVESLGRTEKIPLQLSSDLRVTKSETHTLSDLLERGEIDALIAPRAPSCFVRGAPNVNRLFPQFRTVEQAYFKKTGIFPIMHLVGIKKTLAHENPWLPASLFKAFEEARLLAVEKLRETAALSVMLPWLVAELQSTLDLMGNDFWPYGISKNKTTIAKLVQYHHVQGLSAKPAKIEELFSKATLNQYII